MMPDRLAICLTFLVAAAAASAASPELRVSPNDCLVDEVVHIEAVGLKPQQTVTLRATMSDRDGATWVSSARFTVDSAGQVDLSSQAPIEGTYSGVDPMGLIWSVRPEKRPENGAPVAFTFEIDQPLTTRLEVAAEGEQLASVELRRVFRSPGVRAVEVRDDGLVGSYYVPEGTGPFPALIVLTGSEGGINRADGQLLASRGFASLSLAYFNAEGLPGQLVEIPLEYLKKGIDWLATQREVDRSRLGVVGGSRGGELALLLAATFPELRAVVAYVPSCCVWQGLSWTGPPPDASSWSVGGKGLPYARGKATPAFMAQVGSGKPIAFVSLFAGGLEDGESVEKAIIPVERIRGPILLLSGTEDAVWPSTKMADMVMERLKKHSHPHRYQHLVYEGAGHAVRKAFLPAAGTVSRGMMALGGTEAANARAQADSWPKVLSFLRESLK